ncbi:MAG TPA: indolepyruvate oxidoreductase subunit beta [bacterium]|jgi:indolepyruvate ferredoxin oxidoreductase beta subunit|nr:indolepyruvate oxidoreductase subunit beta [Dictyoglomota bacterium]HHV80234.1 indolepyruvate oxidoreductase subunit beta [bacterium]HOK29314.1 indolepyruvate oxidoreductase subunit beta [bacterium]HOL54466.1 indolepyruvate oxidoreductase subunit beta [bacterium]HPO81488.1 indolepyruvate oxidoreductase subunit beta [bacterium]
MKESFDILIVGVGGQGNILFSKILGEAFLNEGYDVKVSEVHGMAQRGGSVVTFVRAGEKVYSPLVDKAQADYIIAFEKLEALRWLEYLKKDGIVIYSDYEIPPMSVISGKSRYPDVDSILKDIGVRHYKIEISSLLMELKNPRVQNTIMLGFFSKLTGIEKQVWERAIENNIRAKLLDINLRAFEMGRDIELKEEELKV